ncbi:HlyD family secretion protein [Cerasicoccus frondis]|uniref:HlyD family secretion protein n=1 Tax=Cerasicoccus frondis TaxID=490090 RepID=UPI0028527097|nr:HlyD family secretion protein [Cerasicoccus frondis]
MAENSKQETAATPTRSKFNWLIWPVAVLGLIGAGVYSYQRYQFDQLHIVTDNAQVQGQMIKILSPERGWLTQVTVQENQPVKEGELLAELENRYYKLEVERAQARLNALVAQKGSDTNAGPGGGLAQAKLATAKANLEVIQAELAEAQSSADQANDKLTRVKSSQTSASFVQAQLDMATATSNQANAKLLTLQKEAYAAQQQVQEAMANAQLLDYNIEEAKAELAQAQVNLDSTEIKAPISGNVAQLKVNPGTTVEQSQYLMTVVSYDDKWLVANIKETQFERIFIGDLVDITIDAFPGTDFKGVVDSMAPAAGNQFSIIPRNYASGNFIKVEALIPVVIRFTEPSQDVAKLVPGMSAEVNISIDPKRKWSPMTDPSKAKSEDNTDGVTAAPQSPKQDANSVAGAVPTPDSSTDDEAKDDSSTDKTSTNTTDAKAESAQTAHGG